LIFRRTHTSAIEVIQRVGQLVELCPAAADADANYCRTLMSCGSSGTPRRRASTAFDDPLGAYYPDALHEDRFILVGYSKRQRLLYVVHAEVKVDVIRIISARTATTHEKTRYQND